MKNLLTCMLTVAATACSPTPRVDAASDRLFAEAVPICAVLANPSPYVGKRISVSGVYFATPHGGLFVDQSCERGEMPLGRQSFELDDERAQAILNAELRVVRPAMVPAVMAGILTDHNVGDTPGCFMSGAGICQRYSLQSATFVAARRSAKRSK